MEGGLVRVTMKNLRAKGVRQKNKIKQGTPERQILIKLQDW